MKGEWARVGPGLRDAQWQLPPSCPPAYRNTQPSSVDFVFPTWLQKGLWAGVGMRQVRTGRGVRESLALAYLPT